MAARCAAMRSLLQPRRTARDGLHLWSAPDLRCVGKLQHGEVRSLRGAAAEGLLQENRRERTQGGLLVSRWATLLAGRYRAATVGRSVGFLAIRCCTVPAPPNLTSSKVMCTVSSTREGLGLLDQVPSPFGLLSRRCFGSNPDRPDGQVVNAVESNATYTKDFDGIGPPDSLALLDHHGANSMVALDYCQVPSPYGLLSRRYYGTNPDGPDGEASTANESYTEGFNGIGPGDTCRLQNEIGNAATGFKTDEKDLRSEFESGLRPLLASNCLLVPYRINDIRSAYLHGQFHGFTKQETLHLTSLDVMLRIKTLKEVHRIPFIEFLIKRRVLVHDVHEEWNQTYGDVEILEYRFEESDSYFVRAECDASFDDSSKLAKLGIMIWKGKRIIWAEIFDGVKSTSNHHAEVLAALAVLMKCEEFKFSEVKLWSDSQKVIGVINGSECIEIQDPDRKTYLLLRSMN